MKLSNYSRFLRTLVSQKVYDEHMVHMPNRLAMTLNLLALIAVVINMLLDLIFGAYLPLIPLGMLMVGTVCGVILFRLNMLTEAKVIVLTLFFINLYLATSADTYETGSHLYFLTLSLAAFVVFGYEKKHYAFAFATFSTFLYLLSYISDFSVLPEFNFSDFQVRVFFIINVVLFTSITVVILVAYMHMMHNQAIEIQSKNLELSKTNQELDYFLYTSSHDLRAPLATVLGLLQISEKTEDLKEKELYLGLMKESIDKMDDFIEDIISFFKNSRLPIQNEKVCIQEITETLRGEMEHQARLKNVNLNIQIPEGLSIKSDKMRLRNILRNLLSNAIKYSDSGKSELFVNLTCRSNGEFIYFDVKDNGIGIDEEHLDGIWRMFYRASEQSKGAGLGLYIAWETSKKLGGDLSVESHIGDGSVFSLKLPKDNRQQLLDNSV